MSVDKHALCFSASTASLIVIEIIIGVLFLLCIVAALKQFTMLIPAFFCLGIGAFFFLWWKSFKIEIVGDTLLYSSFFGGTKTLPLEEVEKATIEIGSVKYMDRFKPPIRLVIKPMKDSSYKTININLKVFRESDISELIKLLPSST